MQTVRKRTPQQQWRSNPAAQHNIKPQCNGTHAAIHAQQPSEYPAAQHNVKPQYNGTHAAIHAQQSGVLPRSAAPAPTTETQYSAQPELNLRQQCSPHTKHDQQQPQQLCNPLFINKQHP